MQAVTVSVIVARASHSSGATALVFSSLFLPQGLISPIGGLVADRFDRRKVAMAMQWVQAVLATILALVIHAGVRNTFALAGIVLVQGCANALTMPAYSSMIPLLVPREELLGALSLSGITWNTGRAIGPALAAIITGNAVSFVAMALVLTTIKRDLHGGGHVDMRQARSEIANGARLAFRTPGPRTMLITVVVMQLCMATMFSTIPTYAAEVDSWQRLPMVLFACMGTGALVGALSIAGLTARVGRWRVLTGLLCLTVVSLTVAAQARSIPVAMIALVLFGMSSPVSFIVCSSVVQRDSPEHFRGRIVSIYSAIVGLSFGGFSIGIGYIADGLLGQRATIQWSAVVLGLMLAFTHWKWPAWRRLVSGSDPAPHWFPPAKIVPVDSAV
jgi:MFS family permease